jgi:cytochrome c nitrite reductase small subunit
MMICTVLNVLRLPGLPRVWQGLIYALAGMVAGVGLVVVRISNAASYLSDSPQTCINCHVMTDAYASWYRGSHGRVTVCTDCHVPHDNIVAKYGFKAMDGTKHSAVFTLGTEPQVLELSAMAVPVVQKNCIRCHQQQLEMIRLAGSSERTCWDCHQTIHGPLRSLSASPPELRPQLPKAGFEFNPIGDTKNEPEK